MGPNFPDGLSRKFPLPILYFYGTLPYRYIAGRIRNLP
jgi:hypothetical protein